MFNKVYYYVASFVDAKLDNFQIISKVFRKFFDKNMIL